MLTIKMYSSYVKEESIKLFLESYHLKLEPKGKIYNQFNFWTGKRRLLCKQKKEPGKCKEFKLPLARFKIGGATGDLFFSGTGIFVEIVRNMDMRKKNVGRRYALIVCEKYTIIMNVQWEEGVMCVMVLVTWPKREDPEGGKNSYYNASGTIQRKMVVITKRTAEDTTKKVEELHKELDVELSEDTEDGHKLIKQRFPDMPKQFMQNIQIKQLQQGC